MYERIDFDSINAAALNAYPGLLQQWFPQGVIEGNEFCIGDWSGSPGRSLKINIRTGVGTDFASTGDGAGDPISTYAKRFNLGNNMAEAARQLAANLGMAIDEKTEPRNPKPDAEKRKNQAREMLSRMVGLSKKQPAFKYLTGRGLKRPCLDVMRWLPRANGKGGSLAFLAKNTEGETLAYQLIHLTEDGNKADIAVVKQTRKLVDYWPDKCICKLPARIDDPRILLTEGCEDALTLWQETGLETWIAFGIKTMPKAPLPKDRPIVIVRDNDEPGSIPDKDIAKAMRDLVQKGFTIYCARPPTGLKDSNQLLCVKGAEAVCKMVADAREVEIVEEEDGAKEEPKPPEAPFDDGLPVQTGEPDLSEVPSTEFEEMAFYPETDSGNAARLVRRFGDRIMKAEGFGWHTYRNGVWVQDTTDQILNVAKNIGAEIGRETPFIDKDAASKRWSWGFKSQSARAIRDMLTLAAPDVAKTADELDCYVDFFNAKNGIIDLRSGKLIPHNPKFLMTQQSPIEYDPDAKCPLWEKNLRQVFAENDELILYVQRAIGYSFTARRDEQCMFINWGNGSNGKNTIIDIISEIMSGYWRKVNSSLLLAKSRQNNSGPNPEVASLKPARLVTASETGEGGKLDESLIKEVTGDAFITARFLHRNPITFTPNFKMWLSTNYKPSIQGVDKGIWRRIRLIPYTVEFFATDDPDAPEHGPFKDLKMDDKLKKELPGILAWAVRGAMSWYEMGLAEPLCVRDAVQEYRDEQDTVGLFIEECCTSNPTADETVDNIYRAYILWARENGFGEPSKRTLTNRMTSRGFERVRTNKSRGYTGIILNYEWIARISK